jgi:hypothetical protein
MGRDDHQEPRRSSVVYNTERGPRYRRSPTKKDFTSAATREIIRHSFGDFPGKPRDAGKSMTFATDFNKIMTAGIDRIPGPFAAIFSGRHASRHMSGRLVELPDGDVGKDKAAARRRRLSACH